MTTVVEEPVAAGRRPRRLVFVGLVLLLVGVLGVGTWFWLTGHALDEAGAPITGPIVCDGRSQPPDQVVVLRAGTRCTASVELYYVGPGHLTVHSVDSGAGGAGGIRLLPVDGRSPDGGTYRIEERIASDGSTSHRYRIAFELDPDLCSDDGITYSSGYLPIEVSYLGRHRTVVPEGKLQVKIARGSQAACS